MEADEAAAFFKHRTDRMAELRVNNKKPIFGSFKFQPLSHGICIAQNGMSISKYIYNTLMYPFYGEWSVGYATMLAVFPSSNKNTVVIDKLIFQHHFK